MSLSLRTVGLAVVLMACGCGRSTGPDIGSVSGTVTLDGKALPNATILFQPPQGRPSIGHTDESGHYSLSYSPDMNGAILGKQKVVIRSEVPGPDGEPPKSPEILPKKYHAESELSVDVKPGKNTFDFPLTSK